MNMTLVRINPVINLIANGLAAAYLGYALYNEIKKQREQAVEAALKAAEKTVEGMAE